MYHPFQLFQGQEREPLSSNSRRAANAALCTSADKWIFYHDSLYKFQPPEGRTGFGDKDLVAWGTDLGITAPSFSTCVNDRQKAGQVDQMSQYVTGTRKVEGTPTVYLDGKALDLQNQLLNSSALEQAILAAGRSTPSQSRSSSSAK